MGREGRPALMAAPLDVHRALRGLRVPEWVALHPGGAAVACVIDGRAHVLDLPTGALRPLAAAEGEWHALTRWITGNRLLLATARGPLLDHVEVRLAVGEPPWRLDTGAEIEDLIPAGDRVLLRLADPGSERDGSHLGLRVHDPADPVVREPGARLRRLALARVGDDRLTPVPLTATVWDADWRGGPVVAVTSADETPGGFYRPNLDLIDPETGQTRTLYTTGWQLARPKLAPDGRTAVVLEGLSIVSGRVLRVTGLDDGDTRVTALGDLDDVTDLGWLDERRLWFTGWDGTGTHGGLLDAVTGEVLSRWVRHGTLGGPGAQPSLSPDATGTLAAAPWEDAGQPPEIALADPATGEWRAVTALNAGLASLAVRQEKVRWAAPDGREIEGLLLTHGAADGPRPLVVMVHGGPTWLWSSAFAPAESNQLASPLAHAGAAVLLANPRGSSGRGQEHARAVIGVAGEADLDDLLAGVDHLVATGAADPGRMAIMGLSYGGYMTAWATTRTSRFRAAVVMSGVADWLSFATASNLAGGFDPLYHAGADAATPEGREFLAARSPVHHAAEASTPTLILHGELDRTTPAGQAEQLYRAWSAAGIPVQLVVYPREGHELVEDGHRRDAAERTIAWLRGNGVL
ncbi:S9 family peptidase [Nonomuraea sp. NPDC050310]|uniref:alpha/beta hydrolase family protein n=1 Tax=Nonomuraea sp. NPDC050310 TaxID=3154935 RepID=UPI0033CB92D1